MMRTLWWPTKNRLTLFVAYLVLVIGCVVALPHPAAAAACVPPAADYGLATVTVAIPSTATYAVWSSIQAPDTTNNSYLLEIDGAQCFVVGDGALPVNAWQWVDYQDGNFGSKIRPSLAAGPHTFKLIGREPSVQLDKILLLTDSCIPSGWGDNCTTLPVPPTMALTSPQNGATVSGPVNIAATATSNGGSIAKVEFSVDGSMRATDTTSPYNFSWDSTMAPNGTHTIGAQAFDTNGLSAAQTVQVTTQNGDTQAPSVPSGLTATAQAYNKVALSWQASTDNVGVSGYTVVRDGIPVAQLVAPATSYTDTTVQAGTSYTYRVSARDAAGNTSALSTSAQVTTPQPPDTQAPSAPQSLTGTAVSSSQINLSWQASTDNVGVTGYDVYRAVGSGQPSKLAAVTSLSFGDSNLTAGQQYTYSVIARDAAGNTSSQSNIVTVTTPPVPVQTQNTGVLTGKITSQRGSAISSGRITFSVNGQNQTYTTNRQGYYTIGALPVGTYSVRYSAKGYSSQTYQVTIVAGQTTTQNVTLGKR